MATAIAKANRQLKMSSETVSSCLQDLFQQGHITYPRTDSTRIDDGALSTIYDAIKKNFGKEYLYRLEDRATKVQETKKTKKPAKRKSTKHSSEVERPVGNVEDAHEAIRPTNIYADGNSLSLPPHTKAVYELVRRNTLAAFMIPMKSEKISATVKFASGGGEKLWMVLEGKRTAEPGWTRAFQKGDTASSSSASANAASANVEDTDDMTEKEGAPVVRSLSQEEFEAIANLRNALTSSKLSQLFEVRSPTVRENRPMPPLPHSEGSLIEELKNNGVGRPSTYPMIVKTLLTRGYIQVNSKGRCETTPIGRLLVSAAKSTFPSIVDIGFTASFEKKLDLIAKPIPTKRPAALRGMNVSQADYVLSVFLSTFLNYVAEATRAQRARIVERSMRLKHEQEGASDMDEAEFEESVASAKKKVALATGDLTTLPRTHHTFTALQRGLNDYLRRHFPPAHVNSSSGGDVGAGQSNIDSKKSNGFSCSAENGDIDGDNSTTMTDDASVMPPPPQPPRRRSEKSRGSY